MNREEHMQAQTNHYKKVAGEFDEKYQRENRCHARKINLIAQTLNLKTGERVLEVGMGTGIHAKWLLDMSPEIYFEGCDFSPEMIEQARKKLSEFKNVNLFICSGEDLPLEDNSIDKAYISGSLHHFYDKRKGVEELVRVVRPGGIIALSEPNIFAPINLMWVLIKLKTEYGQFHTNPWGMKRFFKDLPVEIIYYKLFNFTPWFPSSWIGAYKKIDSFIESSPLRYLCSMNIIVARKK